MKPIIHISGLSQAANDRWMSMSVTESTNGRSDSVTFTLDDRDYKLEVPQKGKIITVSIGYAETGLVQVGEYQVDQIRHKDSQAASFEITANAQKHRDQPIKVRTVRPWDEKTIQQIVGEIAARSGYSPKVDPDVANFFYDHLDQNEADNHFLQKLAVKHDCYVKFENGQLIFWRHDNAIGAFTVDRGGRGTTGVSLTATISTRTEIEGVAAKWLNRDAGEVFKEIAGKEGQMMKHLPKTYANKAEAKAAATAEFARLARGTGQIESLSFPGDPGCHAGMKLKLVNFRQELCWLDWKITEVNHQLNGSGFTTTVKAECDASKALDGSAGAQSEKEAAKMAEIKGQLLQKEYKASMAISQPKDAASSESSDSATKD